MAGTVRASCCHTIFAAALPLCADLLMQIIAGNTTGTARAIILAASSASGRNAVWACTNIVRTGPVYHMLPFIALDGSAFSILHVITFKANSTVRETVFRAKDTQRSHTVKTHAFVFHAITLCKMVAFLTEAAALVAVRSHWAMAAVADALPSVIF
mmetsp:Transcript_41840/g.97421  ORF Transcript_41840/g.97421 Transcript_41840/m.97421 type:complete len:156 (-) Transcript_41840:270-737(-)